MVLSFELMGVFALAAFAVNVLLMAAHVIQFSLRLGSGIPRKVIAGEVIDTHHADGFAVLEFDQIGRALDGPSHPVELSTQRIQGRLLGGQIQVGGERQSIGPNDEARVWIDDQRVDQCATSVALMQAEVSLAASKPRGYRRTVQVFMRPGDRVWIGEGFVSNFDPKKWRRRCRSLLAAYLVAHLLTAFLFSALAIAFPLETLASKLCAALCVAHFLGSPAIWKMLRDRVAEPDRRRRLWRLTDQATSQSVDGEHRLNDSSRA